MSFYYLDENIEQFYLQIINLWFSFLYKNQILTIEFIDFN